MKRDRTQLSKLCTLVKGTSPISKTLPGQYPLVTTGEEHKTADSFQFDAEAVCIPLISSTGHGHASLKRVHYQTGKFALANLLAAAIVKDRSVLSAKFLMLYLMVTKDRLIVPLMTGAANMSISIDRLGTIPVEFPALAEQERIVKLLDAADELRQLRAQADNRSAALIPALFHEIFAPADFTEKTIGQLLEEGWLLLHKDGNHGSLYPRSSDFGIEGIPFLSATCVTDEGTINHAAVKRLAEEKARLLRHGWIERGDVLLAHNASVGAVGIYDGDYDRAIIGTSLTAFRVNRDHIEPWFLWALLRDVFFQSQLERIMRQALRNQVPITAQRKLFLRIPALPLQREFAARVAEIRGLEAEQAASRRRLEDLFQSSLDRAFKGEL